MTSQSFFRRISAGALGTACVLLLLVPAHASAQGIGGIFHGQVLEEGTGAPIGSAVVQLLDAQRRVKGSAVSDDDGRFLFRGVRPGPFAFRVERLGYLQTTTPYWEVRSGETLEVIVRLDPTAVLIAPLEITASTRSASPMLARFYSRMDRRLGGTFISREQIEQRNARVVTDLLADVPGLRFRGGTGLGEKIASFDRSAIGPGGGACVVQVYVDGVLASRGAPVPLDDLASPASLEGIEVHNGQSTIPAEFVNPASRCGVIALWTRRGG